MAYREPTKKSLGQHFLKDPYIIDRILQLVDPIADDCVVEACNQYNICMVNTGIRLFEH